MDETRRQTFTYLRSYYEAIKELPDKNRLELYDAINDYSFNLIEPNLEGLSKTIWILIEPILKKSYAKYKNGMQEKQNESQKKANRKRKKSKRKANPSYSYSYSYKKEILKIINNYFKGNNLLNNRFMDFMEVRSELKAVQTERAIKLLLNDLENKSDIEKLLMIEKSIKRSWKGLFELDEKEKQELQHKKLPTWFNQKIEKEEITTEEKAELEELLKDFK